MVDPKNPKTTIFPTTLADDISNRAKDPASDSLSARGNEQDKTHATVVRLQ